MAGPNEILRFELEGTGYGLDAAAIRSVERVSSLIPVPGAPAEVLGLAETRGTLVSVLDLPGLLGRRRAAGSEPSVVLLAAPFERCALFLPGKVEMTRLGPAEDAVRLDEEGRPVELVEVRGLLETAASRVRGTV